MKIYCFFFFLPQRKRTGSWNEDKAYSTLGKHHLTFLELYASFLEFKKICPRPKSMYAIFETILYIDPLLEYNVVSIMKETLRKK